MTMNFQSHQEQARTNTFRLALLFGAGLLALILVVSLLLTVLFSFSSGEPQPLAGFAVAAPITTVVIVGASLVKSAQIRGGGGSYVAASLGGRPVDFNTLDPGEKQLSNVVEEIAIASGMPVPALFVLDNEPGINAFAAGWSADNAAIGVTRGALQQLNRRELQGVIAHEFSHIANGDTRVKTRIIGWVFGIAIVTVLGRILLESLWWAPRRRGRDDDNNAAMVMLAVGLGLVIVGFVGTMFARMVQAAVSRQREYLADASAVQYTRDPSGIGEALMKIGALGGENRVQSAHATEAGHLFFSEAFRSGMASHPPLTKRIQRLVPEWNGEFPRIKLTRPDARKPASSGRAAQGQSGRSGPIQTGPLGRGPMGQGGIFGPGMIGLPGMPGMPGMPGTPGTPGTSGLSELAGGSSGTGGQAGPGMGYPGQRADVHAVSTAAGHGGRPMAPDFGGPSEAHIEHARRLLAQIPEATQSYLHTRQGAVAAVLGMLASDEPELRARHLAVAGEAVGMEPEYLDGAGRVIGDLHRSLHLPAIDIALHSIRELPHEHKRTLTATITAIEDTNPHQDLFRWMLRRVVVRHVDDRGARASSEVPFEQRQRQAMDIFAVVAHFNSSGAEQAQPAYEAALESVGAAPQAIPSIETLTFDRLDAALSELAQLDRDGRQRFVSACTAAVLHDQKTTVEEAELIRVVADAVGLPVPPLLPG